MSGILLLCLEKIVATLFLVYFHIENVRDQIELLLYDYNIREVERSIYLFLCIANCITFN